MIGLFPGPLIEANTGDRIVVKVTNDLTNGTAIHWHGMFQNGKQLLFRMRHQLMIFVPGFCCLDSNH